MSNMGESWEVQMGVPQVSKDERFMGKTIMMFTIMIW